MSRRMGTLALLAVLVNIAGLGFVAVRNARTSARTTAALCALRGDLQHRVDDGKEFLRVHPRGALGFTPKQILDGVLNQQRTIQALEVVHCP